MSIEKTRANVVASVWQAIAQSDVDLSALSKEQQTALVEAVADNLLQTVDKLLEEASPAPAAQSEVELEGDEKLIWQGRPFLSLVESYTITNERIKISRGLLGREIENVELIRVQDLDYSQKATERMIGVGDIQVRGHDASKPMIVLRNVRDPEKIYEVLRRAWLDARKRYGLTFQEEM